LSAQDLNNLRFTPGYDPSETIESHQITKTETIVFSMGTNRDQAPFPQYYINGKAFDPSRLDFFAEPGQAVEYILINAQHNVHPFHIHVNRFQVQEMGSELSTSKYPVLEAVLDFPKGVWRDTVIVPPNGRTRIWVQYKNYTGKTVRTNVLVVNMRINVLAFLRLTRAFYSPQVFHCHFLAHEDTGMMATLFIGKPQVKLSQWMWEHYELLLGIGLGVVAFGGILGMMSYLLRGQSVNYQPVAAMNELKSKALD
jgi:FtsP/CotA-like multicopper oxidase with cupredoxin domain